MHPLQPKTDIGMLWRTKGIIYRLLYIVPINKDPAGFYSAFFFWFGYTSQHRLLGQRRNRSAISRRYRDVHSGVIANRIGDLIVDPSDPAFLRHSPPLHTFFFPACRSLLAFVLHRLWPWGFVSVSFSFFFFFLHPRSILLLCYSTLTSNCVCVCAVRDLSAFTSQTCSFAGDVGSFGGYFWTRKITK